MVLTWCVALACSDASEEAAGPTPVAGSKDTTAKVVKAPSAGKSDKPTQAPAPDEPSGDAWIDTAIEEALSEEIMPGTSGEPDPSRRSALKAFFQANPEYRDADRRSPLWEHACGLGSTEAAHAFITNPPPKTPVEVEVNGEKWGVFVAHASGHCTSDDWGYYSSEANQAAQDLGATIAYGNANSDVLIIRKDGKELHRIKLSGQGYIAVRAGKEPTPMMYDPSVVGTVTRYFSDD